jgi:hypothetical protein
MSSLHQSPGGSVNLTMPPPISSIIAIRHRGARTNGPATAGATASFETGDPGRLAGLVIGPRFARTRWLGFRNVDDHFVP